MRSKAVKVAFPDAVPELADFEGKRADADSRARVLSQAFRDLEKNSPEVKEFWPRNPSSVQAKRARQLRIRTVFIPFSYGAGLKP